ncbi:MAG: 3-keto-5-aminohexanoate cleavage protein [Burkholderiaceae bacterium]|nr:3-keto-5-aminohexanoate cleavage protein [Burkholderiaceae bacterium]
MTDTRSPYLINLALTGMVPTRAMSASVPLSHQEIIDDIAPALELGVHMLHLHARDGDGVPTSDPEPFGRLIESIRQLPGGREVLVCITTSGRNDPGFAARSRVLDLDGDMKPDMASLTLSSLNFTGQASINAPDTIRSLAARMLERGIRPELEIFDLGMANFLHVLIKEGLVQGPCYVNMLLGNIAGAQANPMQYAALRQHIPEQAVVAIAGLGHAQLTANTLGLLFADGVRTGLEDNLWLDRERRQPASNLSLVRRVIALAETLQRPLASRPWLRARLGFE